MVISNLVIQLEDHIPKKIPDECSFSLLPSIADGSMIHYYLFCKVIRKNILK